MGVNKKIAILCNYELLPERVGGMDYFFWQFDAKCKQNNIEVHWFFPNRSEHGEYGNLTIFDSNNQNVESFFLDFCFQNNPSYTHVITHFVELCTPFFYKIKRFSNAKVIAVDHNPRPLNGYSVKKKIEKRLKGILFSRYIDLFVGVSQYTVNALVYDFGNHLQHKIKTIYNGVIIDDIKVRPQRNYTNPTFLVTSHLRESKGIQDLIEAVARLPVAIKSKLVIDIYGDGPYKAFLLNKIRDKQLEVNFIFKGSVSNLKELYCQYDYMLQPTHMECFSLSILESLAANVPVITTNVGGNEEVITNNKNGFITAAKDISALQHVIKKVYLGDFKSTQNTRALIETRFSLDSMVDNYLKLI
ncbi:glycosyltransferase family 4 protein [Flavobacterium sp. XS1P32]|uniref:glycosyltransferase family 4 protein n=1 Tax=Flavobacterium sp. XS1P32 TaxID=3401726 RepID=UPI003AAD43F9